MGTILTSLMHQDTCLVNQTQRLFQVSIWLLHKTRQRLPLLNSADMDQQARQAAFLPMHSINSTKRDKTREEGEKDVHYENRINKNGFGYFNEVKFNDRL